MILKSVTIKNYKGIKSLKIDFKMWNQLSGKNACGKTTVMDAVYDILTDKMADGSSTANIRPQDVNGADINDNPIERSIVIEIDGEEHEIKKTTVKKMVKDRQTGERIFKGNDTSYEIDGFPYKKKEYDKWIDDHFSKDTFAYCLNSQAFLSLVAKSTGDARKALTQISGYKADEFVNENPQYLQVAQMMKGHTAEETKKVLNKKLKGIESDLQIHADRLAFLEGKEFPELNTEYVDRLNVIIEAENAKLSDATEKQKKLDELAQNALKMKMEQGDILRDTNADLVKRKSQLSSSIEELNVSLYKTKNEISEYQTRNQNLRTSLAELHEDLHDYDVKITDAKKLTLSEDDKVCPYCGNKLKKDDLASKVKDFEAKKQASIDMLKKFKSEAESSIDAHQKEFKNNEEHIIMLQERIKPLDEQIKILSGQLNQLPDMKKAEDIPEYMNLQSQIDSAENTIKVFSEEIASQKREATSNLQNAERKMSDLKYEYKRISSEKEENEKQISAIKEAIKNYKTEYASVLRNVGLISEFAMASNKDMQNKINKYFKHFQFELFDTTQDGTIVETCRMMVKGIPYGKGLNHGDMILAEIDLVQGFQKMLGVEMPIFVDDAESVDEDRIPEISGQLIVLRRTDEPVLMVTYGKE